MKRRIKNDCERHFRIRLHCGKSISSILDKVGMLNSFYLFCRQELSFPDILSNLLYNLVCIVYLLYRY